MIKRIVEKVSQLQTSKKSWANSQAYELRHAIGFMQEPHFLKIFREFCTGNLLMSKGHKDSIVLRDFFNCEDPDREWQDFVSHLSGKNCLDIGPCVFSPLASWDLAKNRFVVEPLLDKIEAWQRENLGRSVFEGLTPYSQGGDEFIPELSEKIDGVIYCRNVLDHTPNWQFILSNISKYAVSGCRLMLWNEIDHKGIADEGHYEITADAQAFRRLIEQLGFVIVRDFELPGTDLNYGCFAIKK